MEPDVLESAFDTTSYNILLESDDKTNITERPNCTIPESSADTTLNDVRATNMYFFTINYNNNTSQYNCI